jgi:hypothetical protein
MSYSTTSTVTHELTEQEEQIVRETLKSIVDCRQFAKSRRYPMLLEYIVNNTLAGDSAALKERTVGVEVFDRTSDYDPSTDAIVRTTAGEVRRRLAAYFSEHPEAPVRIELPLGGYHVEFHFREGANEEVESREPRLLETDSSRHRQAGNEKRGSLEHAKKRSQWITWTAVLGLLAVVAVSLTAWNLLRNREKRDFWWPVIHENDSARILVGGGTDPGQLESVDIQAISQAGQSDGSEQFMLGNATAVARVCGIFRMQGRDCKIVSSRSATLTEIRNNPVVLIGALDNPWTLKLQTSLRYQFLLDPLSKPGQTKRLVVDHAAADAPVWMVVGDDKPFGADYAIVSRFHSDVTGNLAVIIAGVTQVGTEAAGDFLTDSPDGFKQIVAMAPKGWKGDNFEAVLQVEIIQGSPGRIKIVGAQFW